MSLFRYNSPFDAFTPFWTLLDPNIDASQADRSPQARDRVPWSRDLSFHGPRVDLHSTDEGYILSAEIPGVRKDAIKLDVDEKNHRLSLSGELKSEYHSDSDKDQQQQQRAAVGKSASGKESTEVTKTDDNKQVGSANTPKTLISERMYGSFSRSWVLPETADLSKITAKINDGILTVKIPFIEAKTQKPRPVTIEDGGN